jgi:ligand-binding SRPBCC domain-containing protein
MTTHTLNVALWLPVGRDEVFSFFADAFNLEAITPPWLKFSVLTPGPIAMRAGTLIDYRLRVHGLPLRWRSQITVWDPPFRFVDEQRRGPYRRWIHTHSFEEIDGGTLCRDEVHYAVPGGRFIHWLLVRRDVERIFAYRQDVVRHRFHVEPAPPPRSIAASLLPVPPARNSLHAANPFFG